MEAEPSRYTTDDGYARRRAGLSAAEFREAVHAIKAPLSGNMDVLFDTVNGDVLDPVSNEIVGNLLDELGRRTP